MKFAFPRLLHVFYGLSALAVVAAVWTSSQPSPDTLGKVHVSVATSALEERRPAIEAFFAKAGRVPDVSELKLGALDALVQDLKGNNPYFAVLAIQGVYPEVAGKSIGWHFDPVTRTWDQCSLGTVAQRFKSLTCRQGD